MTTDQYIGEQVHMLQWRNQVPSTTLTTRMGISPATLSRKLHGKMGADRHRGGIFNLPTLLAEVRWSVDDLLAAAAALGVPPGDLLPLDTHQGHD